MLVHLFLFSVVVQPSHAFAPRLAQLPRLPAIAVPRTTQQQLSVSSVVIRSFGGEAVAFFNNLRVPAALVAAAAIKDAFVMQTAPEDIKKSRAWKLLRNSYLLLQMLSFASALSCVFIATHAITQLQVTSINQMAATLGELMVREMEYEYVGVRMGFTTGLLSFTMANALRVRMALRRSAELSWCAMWFLISACASMLAYNNAHTLSYGGYVGLLGRWAELHGQLIWKETSLSHPIAVACIFTFLMALKSLVSVIYTVVIKNADTDGDGVVSWSEFSTFLTQLPSRLFAYSRKLRGGESSA